MPKAFSLASWNVEHFKNQGARVADVVAFLSDIQPDVFGLYEVEGKDVFEELTRQMPGYQFHITEGQQVQEILIGVKAGLTAFFTQKTEFRSGMPTLRPGALLTVTVAGANYPLLFLHTKSGPEPIGWGIRDDMLERAIAFRKVLESAANPSPNYMFLGDLNTMGLTYLIKEHNLKPEVELDKLDRLAAKSKMRRLTKDEPFSWWNGPTSRMPKSNLDQVVAANHLKFKLFANNAEIKVFGWPKEPTPAAQGAWIKKYSDHGLLYLEVQQV
jgi:exonuclease III